MDDSCRLAADRNQGGIVGETIKLSVKQEKHFFNLECEEEAEKMIKRGVAPWRALEEARKIVEKRRFKSKAKEQ